MEDVLFVCLIWGLQGSQALLANLFLLLVGLSVWARLELSVIVNGGFCISAVNTRFCCSWSHEGLLFPLSRWMQCILIYSSELISPCPDASANNCLNSYWKQTLNSRVKLHLEIRKKQTISTTVESHGNLICKLFWAPERWGEEFE